MPSLIGGVDAGRSATAALSRLDDAAQDASGPLDRLMQRPSTLDRLVADGGPLGRFMVGRDDALPAGTSAYTKRSVDMLAGIEAKLGLPRERVLANLNLPMPLPGTLVAPALSPPGANAAPPLDSAIGAARPAVATDADNRLSGGVTGNPATVRA
jgi:hypothetical protein